MDAIFDSHRSIIDAWPSLAAFAEDAGTKYGTAKAMRRRNRIGHEYVAAIVAGAERRGIHGVTAERIADLISSKNTPDPSAEEGVTS